MSEPPVDPKTLWREQDVTPVAIPLETIRKRVRRTAWSLRARNFVEYAAAVVVVIGYGSYVVNLDPWLIKIGSALVVIATLYVVVQMHVRAAPVSPPPEGSAADFVSFQRRQLERQAQALESVPRWYLAPFIPGFCLVLIGMAFEAETPRHWSAFAVIVGLAAFVFVGIAMINRHFARRLRRAIAELETMSEPAQG